MTAFSWVGLGMCYGLGYCFLTDWHWQVRRELGLSMPDSYIKFLLDELTGQDWNAAYVDFGTAVSFFIALLCSTCVNFREWKRSRKVFN